VKETLSGAAEGAKERGREMKEEVRDSAEDLKERGAQMKDELKGRVKESTGLGEYSAM
jgi:uncharacterized protein YcaQ